MSKLETQEICKTYRGRRVVHDVSVFVQQGEVVGLISPDSGRILLNDQDITDLPMYQRARKGISYLPQEASVFRKLTVEENLMAILETRRMTSRERRDKMNNLIDQMGLGTVRR